LRYELIPPEYAVIASPLHMSAIRTQQRLIARLYGYAERIAPAKLLPPPVPLRRRQSRPLSTADSRLPTTPRLLCALFDPDLINPELMVLVQMLKTDGLRYVPRVLRERSSKVRKYAYGGWEGASAATV